MNAETVFYTPQQMGKLFSVVDPTLTHWRQTKQRYPFFSLPGNVRYYIPEILHPGTEIKMHYTWYSPEQLAYFLNFKTHRTLDGWRRNLPADGIPTKGPMFSQTQSAGRNRILYHRDDIFSWLMKCRVDVEQIAA